MLLDFEKAYDRVSHDWLFHILQSVGLPPPLITVLQHTHRLALGSIIINNRLSDPFPIRSQVLDKAILYPPSSST